jgi:DNA-binding CsgD family transcriptional regulator
MLHLSRETVRNHVRNVLREFGAHLRLEAVARAHELGLLLAG